MRSIRNILVVTVVTLALISVSVSAAFAATLSEVVSPKNALLEGDVLTINSKVVFTADGAEVKAGKVVLSKTGKTWEFELATTQEVDLEIDGGVFKLTPMAVGKYASLRKQDDTPTLRTKATRATEGTPTIATKSGKGKTGKKDNDNIDVSSLSLKRSGKGRKTTKTEVTPTTAISADAPVTPTSEVIPEDQWIKNKKAEYRAKNLEGNGSKKNPFTFPDLMRICRWMEREHGWKFEPSAAGLNNANYYFSLTGKQIQHIDYVKKDVAKVETPSYDPDKKYTVAVFIASFYPYDPATDADSAIKINVDDLYTNLEATVGLFGRKMPAGNDGYAIIADKPIRLVGTLPKYAKIDLPRKTYIAGEEINEVVFGNGQFTRWANVGKPITLVDTQSVEATRKAIRPTKLGHLRSMFFNTYAVRKDKKQWVTQVGEDAVIYVPKSLGKVRVASVNYDKGGKTGTALPGEHFSINKGGQCTWNFNHAVNP